MTLEEVYSTYHNDLLSKPITFHCDFCGKSVSSYIPSGVVVRAWIECPECTASKLSFFDAKDLLEQHPAFVPAIENSFRCYNNLRELLDLIKHASGTRVYTWYEYAGEQIENNGILEDFFDLLREMTDRSSFVRALCADIQDVVEDSYQL